MEFTPNGFPLMSNAPDPRPRFNDAHFADQGRSLGALWDSANVLYEDFIEAFGCAVTLVATLFFNPHDLPRMKEWMHSLERFVRRLILAEALARTVDLKPQPPRTSHRSRPLTPEPDLDLDETPPHDWRVSPRLLRLQLPSEEAAPDKTETDYIPSGDNAPPPPIRWRAEPFTGRTFARRLEAMRRVIVWPEPWIARLAARMARAEKKTGQRIELAFPPFDGFKRNGRPWPRGWAELRAQEHVVAAYNARKLPDD